MNETDNKIRAVAFDIDGTLYPNGPMYLASLPVVVRHLKLFRAFGRARKVIRRVRPITDLHGQTATLVADQLGMDRAEAALRIERYIYGEWESTLKGVRLYRGARDLVRHLRERGIRTAAVSDFPVPKKLHLLNLEGLWDVAFSSEETGYLKPNPEPFQRLIRELELPAGQILYVGNSYHYDVEGARSCGLLTAHITRRPPPGPPADFSFRRFSELREWLESRLVSDS
jgi:putative hydrolase of the HAD superfamily